MQGKTVASWDNRPLPGDIRELTSLRFIAALVVIVHHFGPAFWPALTGMTGLVEKGLYGVDFFFMLSGFILTHVYLQAHEEKRFGYVDFVWARLARIYPLHIVTMIAAILILETSLRLGYMEQDTVYGKFIAYNIAMVHAWGVVDHMGLNEPSWSISAEWAAYLAFPIFLVITRWAKARPILFTVVSAALIALLYVFAEALGNDPYPHMTYDVGAVRIMPCFLLGCALNTLARKVTFSLPAAQIGTLASGLGALFLMHFKAPDLFILAAVAALIFFCAQRAKHDAPSLISGPKAVWLGEISFALYMVHRIVEYALTRLVGPAFGWQPEGNVAMLAAALVGSMIGAAALHHAVEKPMRALMRKVKPSALLATLFGKRKATAAE
jgi:peptidoglycan/LPS O-acetylase OafA/YrhL